MTIEPGHADAGRIPLDEVLAQVAPREPVFHREPDGSDLAHFLGMTTDDFFEVVASGRRVGRDHVCQVMADRYACGQRDGDDQWVTGPISARELGPGVWQLYYELDQPGRHTHRSTIWVNSGSGWKVAYHQGTIAHGA